jgi:hypothetical protein
MHCVYIVKVEAIHGPLFVFKNNGSSGKNANKLFCTLPQRRWGQYFSNKLGCLFLFDRNSFLGLKNS